VDGPRTLQVKKKKNGKIIKYYLKQKKDVIIIFKPKNQKLLYKLWTNLPANVMLVTSSGGGGGGGTYTNPMVRIPAGSFNMGDSFLEGNLCERPVHSVYISEFNIDKYEVSNEEMRRVMQWAYDNGKITATPLTVINASGNQQELIDLDSPYCQLIFSNGKFSVKAGREAQPCARLVNIIPTTQISRCRTRRLSAVLLRTDTAADHLHRRLIACFAAETGEWLLICKKSRRELFSIR